MRRNARCRSRVGAQAVVAEPFGGGQGGVEVVLGLVDVAGGRLQPAGEQQARRLVAGGGLVPGRVEGVADPGGAGDAVAEHHPGPAEPVGQAQAERGSWSAAQARAASMLARSARTRARHAGWARAADGGGAPLGGLGEPGGVRGDGVVGQPGLARGGCAAKARMLSSSR